MSLLTPHQQKLKQRRPHSNTISGADRPPPIDTIITSGISHRRNSEGSPRALVPPPINVSAPSPTIVTTHQQQQQQQQYPLESPKTLSLQHHFPDTVMPSSSDDDVNNNNNSSRAATPPVAAVPETKPGTMSRLFAGHKKSRSRGSSLSTHSVNELPDTHAEKQHVLGNSKLRNEPINQQQQPRGSDDASSEMSFAAGSIAAACNVEPANAKRNQDFHALFRSVPEDDPLIEDFGCALQKEILLQGRIYISESHLCFNANIFGWVTNLVIAFSDIVDIEKRTTALFIPNAIQVSTLHAKHFFASFLSRDQAYDLIVDVWRMSRPSAKQNGIDDDENNQADEDNDDEEITTSDDSSYTYESDDESSISEPEENAAQDRQGSLASLPLPETNKDEEAARRRAISEAGPRPNVKSLATQQQQQQQQPPLPGSNNSPENNNNANDNNANKPVQKQEKTECNCLKSGEHYPKVVQDQTFNCTIETMYNLLYNSDFVKKFLTDQKCTDLTISSWHDSDADNVISSREMSYIKPLNGSIGPKSTKCLMTEEILHRDLEDFVTQVTTTQTPDVPSGGSFSVKTRTCLMWAGKDKVRMLVTVLVDFTKSSWLKSTIESASISGQEGYYKELDAAIRHYLEKSAAAAGTSGSHGKKTDKRKKKVKRKHKNKEGQNGGDDNKAKSQNDDQSPWQRMLSTSIDWVVSNATVPNASQISVVCMFMLVIINLYIANKMAQMDRQLEAIHQGVDTTGSRSSSSSSGKQKWEPSIASPQSDDHHEIENELWDWLGQLDPDQKVKTATVQDPSAAWDSMTAEDDNASWDARLRESQLTKDKLDQHMADLEKMIQRASNNMQEVTKVVERQRSRIVENWSS